MTPTIAIRNFLNIARKFWWLSRALRELRAWPHRAHALENVSPCFRIRSFQETSQMAQYQVSTTSRQSRRLCLIRLGHPSLLTPFMQRWNAKTIEIDLSSDLEGKSGKYKRTKNKKKERRITLILFSCPAFIRHSHHLLYLVIPSLPTDPK